MKKKSYTESFTKGVILGTAVSLIFQLVTGGPGGIVLTSLVKAGVKWGACNVVADFVVDKATAAINKMESADAAAAA